jgi:hypothetical protein
MPKQKVAERDVQRACTDLLTAEKVFWVRMNTGAVKLEKRFVRFGNPGMADILAILSRGGLQLVAWLEIKASSGGRQSDEQKLFQASVEARGHVYLLISDVDILRDWLKRHKL